MRRWNGWSEEGVEAHLSERALDLLTQLVGRGTPPPDATLPDVVAACRTDPTGRRSALDDGRPGPGPARSRPEPARLDRPSVRPPRGRPRMPSPARRSADDVRAVMDDAAARGAAPDPVRRRDERRRWGHDPARRPADRQRGPHRDGRTALPRRDQRAGHIRGRDARPGDRGGPGADRSDARPLPAVVRAFEPRGLGRDPLRRPGVDRLRPHRGAVRRRPPRDSERAAGPADRIPPRRPDRTCASSSSARRAGSGS